ncbi:Tetratricopeptide repeat-containing protein [Desulfonema limicola]|uniref:Tetratricopeptide repeat-containing protein n=1 Tax=Desulfonema limicola TaxID=45656 RepID=A0A975B6F6_9BACT|nr:tetratricopeptide repeat protein [Desulfonema limicola]QTA79666.1 Tetratricopeptide repeat-containing protein [Desulfonema limicola]
MNKKQTQSQETKSINTKDFISRQNAIWFALTMLVTGFVAGTIFGVMKTSPISDKSSGSQEILSHISHLEEETGKNPQNAEAWEQLGHAYFDTEQYKKAIAAYEKYLAIEPENPNILTDLGVMYRRNKQPEKAVEAFTKAMDIDPKHEISRMNKGIVLLYDLQDEKGAIQAWESLLEINPLAVFGDGQSVDERIQHYKQEHEKK